MVQIIQENKRPSFAQSIMGGIAENVGPAFEKYQQNKQIQVQNKQAIEAGKKLLGMDLSGFDPETRKALLVEGLKQQGKGQRTQEQQNYLDRLFGGKKPSSDNGITFENENDEFNFGNVSDEDIIRGEALGIKGVGEAKTRKLKEKNDIEVAKRKTFESDREYHSKTSDPILKEAASVLKEAPIKKGLIDQQRRDIASGQTAGIIPFLVEKTGADVYRNPESARFKTASKQRFVESLHQLGATGARANQFIEQQLVGAQASLGRNAEANQTVLDLEEFVDDLKAERAKYETELAEEDMQKYGYARNDIGRRADKKMTGFAEQRQDEMAYDIRKRHEQNLSDEDLTKEIIMGEIAPDTPLTLRAARILMIKNNDDEKKAQAEAKKLGFRLPNEKTYMRG